MKQFVILSALILCTVCITGCHTSKSADNELGNKNNQELEKNDMETLIVTGDNVFGEHSIPSSGLVYRDEKYGFQIMLGSERSGGKIYDSYISFYEDNNDNFNDDSWIKNPMRLFAVPSPWRPGTFELIAHIQIYTYDEYNKERQNQMDSECIMCSIEEFDNDIIGKNNKYYFLLAKSNRAHSELIDMFPSLKCREEIVYGLDSSYGTRYTEIFCDGGEYIDGKREKTGNDWIDQLLPMESFDIFDVE